MVDLGATGSGFSSAGAVNARGDVVGFSGGTAFAWTQSQGRGDPGSLAASFSTATAVSPSGQIVGWAEAGGGGRHAFSWTEQDGMVDLGTLPGTEDSYPVGVTPSGEVVGHSDHYNSLTGQVDMRAFSWTKKDGMVELGTLGGTETRPNAVSPTGQVVGSANSATSFAIHAFSWTAQTGAVDLGTLGGRRSDAVAVNARGQIVGSSILPSVPLPGGGFISETRAVLWEPS
jgi:probable HAF family extracellular repeat protein